MARVGVAGFHQLFLAEDDGLFLGDETLQHGSVLSRIGRHGILRDLRYFIFFATFGDIHWLFRDRRYFTIFAIFSGVKWLTGRARVRGRARVSADAIVVEVRVSKFFS